MKVLLYVLLSFVISITAINAQKENTGIFKYKIISNFADNEKE
jgi:hypothetical protein